MKKFLTKTTALTAWIIYSVFGFFTESLATIGGSQVPPDERLIWGQVGIDVMIMNIVAWILKFLFIIGVIIFIVAWLMIMTAGWDDDKVKKGKTWMINAIIWLFVIFIAHSVVKWVIDFMATWWQGTWVWG